MVVLKTEREPGFLELIDTLVQELDPRTPIEMGYVQNMAVARWRQSRLWAMQTATLDIATEDQPLEAGNEPVRVALAFQALADHSNTLVLLQRYETANDRLFNRSLNMLLKLRAKVPPPVEEPHPAEPAPPEVTNFPKEPNLPSKPPARERGRNQSTTRTRRAFRTSGGRSRREVSTATRATA